MKIIQKLVRKVTETKKPELTWEQLQDRVRQNNFDWLNGRGEYAKKVSK